MNTKQLISNIESLSVTLSQQQLAKFLDIVDELATMAKTSQQVSKAKNENEPSHLSTFH